MESTQSHYAFKYLFSVLFFSLCAPKYTDKGTTFRLKTVVVLKIVHKVKCLDAPTSKVHNDYSKNNRCVFFLCMDFH